MKKVNRDFFQCEICKQEYETRKQAEECEERGVTNDSGVKVGDTVVVVGCGDGVGQKAKITSKIIADKYWGHYAWKKYWHTPLYCGEFKDGCVRTLAFDEIKMVCE